MTATRALIVEDDGQTAHRLRQGLTEHGFSVEVAYDGNQALTRLREREFDIVVLDVLLPQLDGWSVLSEIRRVNDALPVLLLTARDSVADRVRGLNLGADDYLIKPFAFSELIARMEAILRRTSAKQSKALTIADLEIDFVRHKAFRCGKPLDLTPKEFALLSLLARRNGEVLSRALIAEQVWGINFDSETNFVDVHIRRLRSKVDEPFAAKLIHTVRGVGYVVEGRERQ